MDASDAGMSLTSPGVWGGSLCPFFFISDLIVPSRERFVDGEAKNRSLPR
jgi:hypothetical protein